MVVRDQDVDPPRARRSRPRRRLRRPAVDGDDDASPRHAVAASIAASDRPWPSSQRDRDVRDHVDAEPAEGEDEDREPGQSVRVEVAEHEHPFAAARGRGRSATGRRSASGSSAGSWRAVSASGHERREIGGLRPRRPPQQLGEPSDASAVARSRAANSASMGPLRGNCQRKRGSITASGCQRGLHPAYLRRCAWPARRHALARGGLRAVAWRALATLLPLLPDDEERRGVEDRRVGARDDADEQREDERRGSPRRRTAAARAA